MSEPKYTGFEYEALQHMRAEIEAPLKEHIGKLMAELAALRADAMRYRLIKAKLRRLDIAGLSITEATAFQLDARIDAMQAAP